MQKYVAGFAFNDERVLLVRKQVPRWQVGLLNGVGGKIEVGETPGQAMPREFGEETTLPTDEHRWRCFCVESGVDYEVHFFKTQLSKQEAEQVLSRGVNDVGEVLWWYRTDVLEIYKSGELVGNLHWLIPMAQDWRDFQARLTVKGNIRERPTWQTW